MILFIIALLAFLAFAGYVGVKYLTRSPGETLGDVIKRSAVAILLAVAAGLTAIAGYITNPV